MKMNLKELTRNLSSRELKLLKITIIVFILWSIYWIFNPKVIELNQKRKNLEAVKAQWATQGELRKENINFSKIRDERERLLKTVPTNNPISDLMVDIEMWSGENNVKWISLDSYLLEDEVTPIKIHLKGELNDLLKILGYLEKYPISMELEDVELAKVYSNYDDDIYSSYAMEEWELKLSLVLYYREKDFKSF